MADPMNTPPSKNSTVPVLPEVIVAVKVTSCPSVEAFGVTVIVVVVGRRTLVGSITLLRTPPFKTEACALSVEGAAPGDTLTPIEIVGKLAIPDNASERVQVSVARVQVQPLPAREVTVRPAGKVAVTIVLPAAGRNAGLATKIW